MSKELKLYKAFIDGLVDRKDSMTARWVKGDGFPQTDDNKAKNDLFAALTPAQREVLAEILQDEHIAGIHDALAYINEMIDLEGLELHQDGESYPNDYFESLHYFGKFGHVFHELSSPDIHVDICVVPPSQERDYYTLVTMGMGAHRMNVPEALAEYKLERAELAIALPRNWKLKHEDLKNERWYWPIRLLKTLARLPIASDTWLGFGHTMDNEEDFAENTKLCAAILTPPQGTEDGSEVCTLPGGEEVNFYQVLPLYRDELEYKLAHDADALLDKMNGISFVAEPDRQNAATSGTLSDGNLIGNMDDAAWHLETIREKHLPVDEINAYNHMAIYLRWCMEHDLMSVEFIERYSEQYQAFLADIKQADLRSFIRY